MNKELLEAIALIEKEKNIDREILLTALEESLTAAYSKSFDKTEKGGDRKGEKRTENIRVILDRETGDYRIFREKTVVEEIQNPATEILLADAREISPAYQPGDVVREELPLNSFSRVTAQNAKNNFRTKLLEEERRSVFERYNSKLGQIVTGIVQRRMEERTIINLGNTDAILPKSEQIETENYRNNERIKVLVLKVEARAPKKEPVITVSRTHPDMVRRFFEAEVPEIKQGLVEIKAVAREAGSRSKMAVVSYDEAVDPIGACVGLNGTRVNAVVDELGGEKIDLVEWRDHPAEFIENALKPAKVIVVLADEEDKTAQVIVPDFQLSLAIGRAGQNVRLAARLTGFKIDIKSETEARESGLFEEIGYIDDYEDNGEGYYEEGYEEEYVEEGYEEEYVEEPAENEAER
ncbi:MAG: transcription termination/antitermination protein NusA [Lachnospiraceae bacterium]|nr:transcription termination/antitermination protein NusA [Lachnospiraceae bacterium]